MTLSELVTLWRSKLDDTNSGGYMWSNEDLTDYCNRIADKMCRELGLIFDTSTPSICTLAVAVDDGEIAISDRIIRIKRAKLSSQQLPLPTSSIAFLDQEYLDWENTPANIPRYLVNVGVTEDTVMLYPVSNAIDTLNLRVLRLPLADLVWDTDQDNSPEIPAKYHRLMINGILWLAYGKQDADTYNGKKEEKHLAMFRMDMEEIRQDKLDYTDGDKIVQPLLGNM